MREGEEKPLCFKQVVDELSICPLPTVWKSPNCEWPEKESVVVYQVAFIGLRALSVRESRARPFEFLFADVGAGRGIQARWPRSVLKVVRIAYRTRRGVRSVAGVRTR